MNYISEYEDLKFEAEVLKTLALISATPFGNFVMQMYFHGINLNWEFLTRGFWAISSLGFFTVLIYAAHDRIKSREKSLNWLHRRRTI